jgi:hypothetical protein
MPSNADAVLTTAPTKATTIIVFPCAGSGETSNRTDSLAGPAGVTAPTPWPSLQERLASRDRRREDLRDDDGVIAGLVPREARRPGTSASQATRGAVHGVVVQPIPVQEQSGEPLHATVQPPEQSVILHDVLPWQVTEQSPPVQSRAQDPPVHVCEQSPSGQVIVHELPVQICVQPPSCTASSTWRSCTSALWDASEKIAAEVTATS